jgi:hypothetical protein
MHPVLCAYNFNVSLIYLIIVKLVLSSSYMLVNNQCSWWILQTIWDTITYYQRNTSEFKWIDISEAHYATLFLCIYGHASDSETFLCTPCDSYVCVYMDIHQIQKHCLAHHVTIIYVDISTSDSETFPCVYMDKLLLRLSFLFRFVWNYCVLFMYIISCPLHFP